MNTLQQLMDLTPLVGALGVALYVAMVAVKFVSGYESDQPIILAGKMTAVVMMLLPILLRWYLSEHMLLWFGIAICAVGVGYKIKAWWGV